MSFAFSMGDTRRADLLRADKAAYSTMRKIYLGRHVFGLAAILFGICTLAFKDFNIWQQIHALGNIPHREILIYVASAMEIAGGIAIQWRRTARVGAALLGVIYLAFALLWIPRIIAEPGVYDRWGNFFEQFSQVAGAIIVYAIVTRADLQRRTKLAWTGYYFFALCVVSFTLEQLFYLSGTAGFVPRWIPLSPMFWAVATTIFFALAAVALLVRRCHLLASRLLTVMIIGFQLLVWIPAPMRDPHQLTNWAGNAQNLSIAGAAWIVMDLLGSLRAEGHSL